MDRPGPNQSPVSHFDSLWTEKLLQIYCQAIKLSAKVAVRVCHSGCKWSFGQIQRHDIQLDPGQRGPYLTLTDGRLSDLVLVGCSWSMPEPDNDKVVHILAMLVHLSALIAQ